MTRTSPTSSCRAATNPDKAWSWTSVNRTQITRAVVFVEGMRAFLATALTLVNRLTYPLPMAKHVPPKDPQAALEKLLARGTHGQAITQAALAPVDWVWHPYIVGKTVNTLGGPPAAGKSTLLFWFLVARASSRPLMVLGRTVTPAPAGQWVVLVEEQHEAGAARKLLRAVRDLHADPECLQRILVLARDPVIVGDVTWGEVGALAASGLVSDVAVDTLANCTKEQANDEQEQIELYRKFKAIANAGVTVWVVAHSRKNSDDAWHLADLSGSQQRGAQSDSVCMLEIHRDKDGNKNAITAHWEKLREELPENETLAVAVKYARNAKLVGTASRTVDAQDILDFVRDHGPSSISKIRHSLGCRPERVKALTDELVQLKKLSHLFEVVEGNRCKVFHLTSSKGSTPPSGHVGGNDDDEG